MDRRNFMMSGLASGLSAGPSLDSNAGKARQNYITLEWFRCRRDHDLERMRSFLGDSLVPAHNRAGIRPVGVFQPLVGPSNPSYLVVTPYASMASVEETRRLMDGDDVWVRESRLFEEKWEPAYDRREAYLLKSFRTVPGIEEPRTAGEGGNLFELRVYESRTDSALARKIAMFEQGEIDIFRRLEIRPVFFGYTLFGERMPNLTYLVCYPSWEARKQAWARFARDPEWKKLSSTPGNSDRELVSSISNQLLTPFPQSQVK